MVARNRVNNKTASSTRSSVKKTTIKRGGTKSTSSRPKAVKQVSEIINSAKPKSSVTGAPKNIQTKIKNIKQLVASYNMNQKKIDEDKKEIEKISAGISQNRYKNTTIRKRVLESIPSLREHLTIRQISNVTDLSPTTIWETVKKSKSNNTNK